MLRLIILVIALGAGGAAAYLISIKPEQVETTQIKEPASNEVEVTDILIAASDIRRGQQISANNVEWQKWPRSAIRRDFIERLDDASINSIVAKFAVRSLIAGQPVQSSFLSESPTGYLPALLEPGKRAVAIQISAQTTAGGFVLPNDFVDVLQTLPHPAGTMVNGQELITKTILRKVRVLAIDQMSQDPEQDVVIGSTATLELTPVQAEKIVTAQASGDLSLALRPLSEQPNPAPADAALVIQAERPDWDDLENPKMLKIFRPTGAEILVVN